jgi:hypothetical protein
MGDDNKKPFWTSLPGILTGIAAVIVAVGGIFTAYNHISPSPPPASSPLPSTPPASSPSPSSQQVVCGTQLPGITLFGTWNWFGSNHGVDQSGIFTFKSDCTYTDKAKSGFMTNDEGNFIVSSSSPASITLTNKISSKEVYFKITNISENSFHAATPDYTVNFDFVKAS